MLTGKNYERIKNGQSMDPNFLWIPMAKKKNALMLGTRPMIVANRIKFQLGLQLFKEFTNLLMHDSDIRREAYEKQRYTDALAVLFPSCSGVITRGHCTPEGNISYKTDNSNKSARAISTYDTENHGDCI